MLGLPIDISKAVNLSLAGEVFTDREPWILKNLNCFNSYCEKLKIEAEKLTASKALSGFEDNYPYSSYSILFFFKDNNDFLNKDYKIGEAFNGIAVAISRLGPCYTMWEETRDPSGLTSFLLEIDRFSNQSINTLANKLDKFFHMHLTKLNKEDLVYPLTQEQAKYLDIGNNLHEPPYKNFDAFFHWYD